MLIDFGLINRLYLKIFINLERRDADGYKKIWESNCTSFGICRDV